MSVQDGDEENYIDKAIDETVESEGYKCPYCGYMHTCDDWGYDYDGEIETCGDCGKKFYATASHSVDFYATPDCELNGIEHDLVFYKKREENSSYFCDICNKCVLKTHDK